MSVWSSISGEVSFKRTETTSLRDLAKECFGDEYTIRDSRKYNGDVIVVNFEINFCLDGEEATNAAHKFQKFLKGHSPSCMFDLVTNVRYLY